MKHRLANFLFRYRTTPKSTTGVTPAELIVKRRLRTRLSLIKPNLEQAVENKQEKQKTYKNLKCKRDRTFARNDRVRVRNTGANFKTDKWILGTAIKVCGPPTCVVRTRHKTRYVHTDHLIRADDHVPDDVSEPEVIVPESSGRTVTDINVNSLDSICNPHVNLSENEDSVLSPTVVSSPPTMSPVLILRAKIALNAVICMILFIFSLIMGYGCSERNFIVRFYSFMCKEIPFNMAKRH